MTTRVILASRLDEYNDTEYWLVKYRAPDVRGVRYRVEINHIYSPKAKIMGRAHVDEASARREYDWTVASI